MKKIDEASALGTALNNASAAAIQDKDILHNVRVELIGAVLDARDDAMEELMVQLPVELHTPVHKAITGALKNTLATLDENFVVLPKDAPSEGNPEPLYSVVINPLHFGEDATGPTALNVAGDLATIFTTMYDNINN